MAQEIEGSNPSVHPNRLAIRRVRRPGASAIVALALLVVGALPLLAACGGGGGSDTSAGLIHRLLVAAGGQGTGNLESFPGRLPDGLPVKPPQYPGARLVVSSREPAPVNQQAPQPTSSVVAQPLLYLIVLDTGAKREDVLAYYVQALDGAPWQLEGTYSTQDLDTLSFSDAQDADISGVVSIARSAQDDRTSILISLQDAGAFRQQLPPFKPGPSLKLPKQFPTDVSVYPQAIVTGNAYFRQPANDSLLLIFLTTASQDAVLQFYRDAFQRNGWTVLSGASLGVADKLGFNDAKGDIQGSVLADRFARDAHYTEVRLQLFVNPARTPVSITPGPSPTRSTATPASAP